MRIEVNGEPREVDEGTTVAGLVRELGLRSEGIAVAVNRRVVPRGRHGEHRLREGDRVEVIRAVGGG